MAGWKVIFKDGSEIQTGYHPNPRMAVAEALTQHKGKIADVKYIR